MAMTQYEEKVINTLKEHRYLERRMLQHKIFTNKAGGRYTRDVLLRMYQRELINRFRNHSRDEYIYHLGKKSQKWRHWLDLNRFHFSLLADLRQWQKLIYWDFEVKYPYGQADGFYVIRLTLQKDGLMFFLEMDDGANKFDKIQKYTTYQQSYLWQKEWWGKQEIFPLVVIVTPREKEIKELIKRCEAEKFFKVIGKAIEYPGILKKIKEE